MEYAGTPPKGIDLMRRLIELLADQEGIQIDYEIEHEGGTLKGSTKK